MRLATFALRCAYTLAALLVGAGAAVVRAQTGDAAAADAHQRIAAERAAALEHFAARQRECMQRFIVTACVDDAKRERNETLSRLRRQQNALGDSQRKARAAERTEAIRQKKDAEAAREREATTRADKEPGSRPSIDHPHQTEGPPTTASGGSPKPSREPEVHGPGPLTKEGQRTAQEEARSRATFDAAQRAAAAHRAEVEERNARRATQRKPAASLPLPPGASAP
jgi:colicin import membrane protein